MVVGMIACFGSVAHAPLGLILMVAEMTGSLALLPPAIVAIGLATLVVGDESIYESQLRSRADAPAHRATFGLPMLNSVLAAEVMSKPRLLLPSETVAQVARRRLDDERLAGAPVVKGDGTFVGVLLSSAVNGQATDAGTLADHTYPTIAFDQGLDAAVEMMASAGADWVPVIENDRVVGIVGMHEVIDGYQANLRRSLRRLAELNGSTVLVEAPVGERSPFAGTTVASAPWPPGTFALSIDRRSHLIVPRGETVLQCGDVIAAVVPADAEGELRTRLDGDHEPDGQ
jgi:CBS domain-containing protein